MRNPLTALHELAEWRQRRGKTYKAVRVGKTEPLPRLKARDFPPE